MMRGDSGKIGVLIALVAAILAIGVVTFLLVRSSEKAGPGIVAQSGASPEGSSRPEATGATSRIGITPGRFVEAAEQGETRPEQRLEIEIVAPNGKPAARARLVLHRGKEVLGLATTDAQGLARFEDGEGEASLVVLPDGAPIHKTTISREGGRRRIQLPAGVAISGRIEISGGSLREPLAVQWHGDEEIPGFLWTATKGEAFATTLTSGEFEFAGLREGSEWRVTLPVGYRVDEVIRDGRVVFAVVAPATGIVIKATRIPLIRGRVVSGDTHLPVARASMSVSLKGSSVSMASYMQADEHGRFRAAAGSPFDPTARFTRLEIEVRGPNKVGTRTVVLEPLPEEDVDLGDVEIPTGRTIRFIVRDPAGSPIEAALARVREETDLSSRTDAAGRGAITVGDEDRSIFVGALKHQVAQVAIPDVIPELLSVSLLPACGLDVRIAAKPGSAPERFSVRVSCPVEPDSGDLNPLRNDPVLVSAGATGNGPGWVSDKEASSDFKPSPDGRVVVADLKAGTPHTIVLTDALGQQHDATVVTLNPAEWRSVELRVTKSPRTLRGTVRDEAGKPVAGARVVIAADRDSVGARRWGPANVLQITGTTDVAGGFVVAGAHSDTVHFVVDKPGFVPLVRRDFALPQEGVALELTLRKGFTLTVQVVAFDGTPIRDLSVWAQVEGFPKDYAESTEPGVFVFRDMPPNLGVMVRTEWGNREWTRSLVLKGDHVERITMPATGEVIVDVSALGLPPFLITLKPADDVEPAVMQAIQAPKRPGAAKTDTIVFAPVAPGEYVAAVEVEGPDGNTPAAAPMRLTVAPGTPVRITFRKP